MSLTKVSTDGVKDDAITSGKIPANAVGASELADNAVDTNAIANNAVTAGKTSGVQTTINSNGANRVITGSNTANTLNGETNVHVTSNKLLIGTSNVNNGLPYTQSGGIQTLGAYNTSSINIVNNENSGNTSALTFNKVRGTSGGVSASDNMGGINWGAWDGTAWRSGITVEGKLTGSGANNVPSKLTFKVNSGSSNTERFAITPNGVTFNGDTAAANALDDYEEGTFTPVLNNGGGFGTSAHTGMYTKVGRLVTYVIQVSGTRDSSSSSGTFTISGLPFTANSATGGHGQAGCMGALFNWNVPSSAYQIGIRVADSNTFIQFFANFDNANDAQLTSPFDANKTIFGSLAGHYYTS